MFSGKVRGWVRGERKGEGRGLVREGGAWEGRREGPKGRGVRRRGDRDYKRDGRQRDRTKGERGEGWEGKERRRGAVETVGGGCERKTEAGR